MNIDTWIAGCKVRSFPWIDHKTILFNVQYYAPGQSLSKPPVWDRTVYIVDNAARRRVICEFAHSLVTYISTLPASRFELEDGKRLLFDFFKVGGIQL